MFEDDNASAAIIYAADAGAKVISFSWGDFSDSSVIHDAINYALGKDCVVVAAAGNYASSSPFYPAAYPGVLAVAATTSDDHRSAYSDYGTWVGISAPGDNVYSTYLSASYLWMSGTSMATPLVAGIAGLVRSKFPAFANTDVVSRLESTADNLDALNPDYIGMLGGGRVNAFNALYTPPSATLEYPVGGERIAGGIGIDITYAATSELALAPNPVSLYYSTDSGFTWNTITAMPITPAVRRPASSGSRRSSIRRT